MPGPGRTLGSDRAKQKAGNPLPPKGMPPIPKSVTEAGLEEVWNGVCSSLEAMDLLFQTDGLAIERYCHNLALWRECAATLNRIGLTYCLTTRNPNAHNFGEITGTNPPEYAVAKVPQPEVKMMHSTEKFLRDFERSFGLTPVARTYIETLLPPEAEGDGGPTKIRFRSRV